MRLQRQTIIKLVKTALASCLVGLLPAPFSAVLCTPLALVVDCYLL